MKEKEMVRLSRKDAECMARILQSVIFKPEYAPFYGCRFCTYSNECFRKSGNLEDMYIDEMRINLQSITGAYLGFAEPLNDSQWTIKELHQGADDGMERKELEEMVFVFPKEEALKDGNIERIFNKIETDLRGTKQTHHVKIIFK